MATSTQLVRSTRTIRTPGRIEDPAPVAEEEPAPPATEQQDEEEIELVQSEPIAAPGSGISTKRVSLRWLSNGFKIKDALMSLSAPDYQSHFAKNDLVETRKKDGE